METTCFQTLVVEIEVDADDEAGDEHDDRALDHLVLARPLDLLELRPATPATKFDAVALLAAAPGRSPRTAGVAL